MYLMASLAESLLGLPSTLWMIFLVVVGIGLVIFVHELGHFLAAKACGVKVEKFYVGFDTPSWRLFGLPMPGRIWAFQHGETEYGIGIIPLGGYVKMLGQDDNPARAAEEAERTRIRPAADGPEDSGAIVEGHEPVPAAEDDSPGRTSPSESTNSAPDDFVLDPRSYTAKSVPQRMLIISAGIIMNLIFAVIFAAIAYRAGVLYMPAQIGKVAMGDPAWVAGIQPGDKVLQIGRSGSPQEHIRFDKDLQLKVALAGIGRETAEPVDFLVRTGDEQPRWITIQPRHRIKDGKSPGLIGITSPLTTTLASEKPVVSFFTAGQANPPFQPGDRIVGVDGSPLARPNPNEQGDFISTELEDALVRLVAEPVRMTVERKEEGSENPTTVDIVVPPQPFRWLGFSLEMGPIVALRPGSPAEQAGMELGDVLVAVDGAPVGDPITLGQRLHRQMTLHNAEPNEDSPSDQTSNAEASSDETSMAGEFPASHRLTVRRGDGESAESIDFEVQLSDRVAFDPLLAQGSYAGVETLGVAYQVFPVVGEVAPGSAAEQEGLRKGDRLKSMKRTAQDEAAREVATEWLTPRFEDEQELDDDLFNGLFLSGSLQQLPEGIDVQLTVERDGVESVVVLPVVDQAGMYYVDRGLRLIPLQRIHQATGLVETISLGYRETVERLSEVTSVLGMLLTGRVSVTNLGGPVRIAAFAGSEASLGIPRLLMFLTFLSANLALLNALPIPVLDGGHFLFLLVEGVIRRPVPEQLQMSLTFAGFVALISLMLFVFANDFLWLFFG